MTSKKQIKADEEKVAIELLQNPSSSIAKIARKCGLSKQKTWRIIYQMEEMGAILSHPASLNMRKLGKRTFLILFERSFKAIDDGLIEKVMLPTIHNLAEKGGVRAKVEDSYYLNGAYDWAIILTVDKHEDLIKWMEIWRKCYGEYFARVTQSEVMFIQIRNGVRNCHGNEIVEVLR